LISQILIKNDEKQKTNIPLAWESEKYRGGSGQRLIKATPNNFKHQSLYELGF
jgi:hypothetical protein